MKISTNIWENADAVPQIIIFWFNNVDDKFVVCIVK